MALADKHYVTAKNDGPQQPKQLAIGTAAIVDDAVSRGIADANGRHGTVAQEDFIVECT